MYTPFYLIHSLLHQCNNTTEDSIAGVLSLAALIKTDEHPQTQCHLELEFFSSTFKMHLDIHCFRA